MHDQSSKYLTVVIPAYNEEARIGVMLDETIAYLQDRQKIDPDFTWELVVVDDGSRDKTVEVVQKYVAKHGTDLIRVNKLRKNVGKGGAVRRGMLVARGKYILMADADGATRFSDFLKLENNIHDIERNNLAVIVGSRAQYHEAESESESERVWRERISTKNIFCTHSPKFLFFTRDHGIEIYLILYLHF